MKDIQGKGREVQGKREQLRERTWEKGPQDLGTTRLKDRSRGAENHQMRSTMSFKEGGKKPPTALSSHSASLSNPNHRVMFGSRTRKKGTGVDITRLITTAGRKRLLLLGPFLENVAKKCPFSPKGEDAIAMERLRELSLFINPVKR